MRFRTAHLVALLAAVLSSVVWAQGPNAAVKRDSERMQKNVAAILTRAATPPTTAPKGKAPSPLRTTFTDKELNAWLVEDGRANVPPGLLAPTVTFTGPAKLTLHAVIDLDAVRKSRERGMLDPMAYLSGQMEISMRGVLTGASGLGTFDVEIATLNNVAVPKLLLQELITYYSRSPEFPDGITLTKPFPLPARVRDLAIQRGSAVVVQ